MEPEGENKKKEKVGGLNEKGYRDISKKKQKTRGRKIKRNNEKIYKKKYKKCI